MIKRTREAEAAQMLQTLKSGIGYAVFSNTSITFHFLFRETRGPICYCGLGLSDFESEL